MTFPKRLKRPNRPLFLIDLAVPRDIPECVGRLENVYLYNLDALAKIANETLAFRKSEIKKAEQLIQIPSLVTLVAIKTTLDVSAISMIPRKLFYRFRVIPNFKRFKYFARI